MDLKDRHLGYRIKKINEALEKSANAQLTEENLTLAQFQLLLYIHLSPGGDVSLKDAEKFLHVAQSTAAGIAIRLERTGKIECYQDEKDKRVKRLRIKEEGREACHHARENIEAEDRRLVSLMTEEEQQLFADLVDKAYEAMVEGRCRKD